MSSTNTQSRADAARVERLRSQIRSGPVTLEQAAETLGLPPQDLMAAIIVGELQAKPLTAAILSGREGCITVKRAGDGELTLTVPAVLGQIMVAALFVGDPSLNAAICSPLPGAPGSKEIN